MKTSQRVLQLFLFPALLCAAFVFSEPATAKGVAGDVKIVAHRGAMSEQPENTMPAFERAVGSGGGGKGGGKWSNVEF